MKLTIKVGCRYCRAPLPDWEVEEEHYKAITALSPFVRGKFWCKRCAKKLGLESTEK